MSEVPGADPVEGGTPDDGADVPTAESAPQTDAAPPPSVPPSAPPTPSAPAPNPAPPAPAAPAAPEPSPTPSAPVPRPGPPPAAATATGVMAGGAAGAGTDSGTFGRVDADGTVWVRLPAGGEHAVGQWAAGEPAAGLAFFARKYDDIAVEVDLATRRLREGKAGAEQAEAVVRRARESLAEPAMVGDLGRLEARVTALHELVEERREAANEEKAAARERALAAREQIAAEAESLADSTHWKATGDRFKALLETWKSTPRADRASEQELWKRFSHARSVFDKRRRQHFAKLDGERGEARQVKEALVREAEALSGSKDWAATSTAYRDLMARWKAAGRAGRVDEERLWTRFRTAQDAFFAARSATYAERDAGQQDNLRAKLALLSEAEAIDTGDLTAAKAALRSIQDRWEAIGHVPRGDKDRVEGRLRRVEEAIRRGDQEQWRRTNPEARARAEATVAQFRASLGKLEGELERATTNGDERAATDLRARIESTSGLLAAAERAAAEFGG